MTAWWSGSLTVFDLESDSPEPTQARIITAYVNDIRLGEAAPGSHWMVRPERPIPAEASAVHGITTEQAEAEGMEREEAIFLLAQTLSAIPDGAPLVAYNARYDLTLLDREMRRTGIGSLGTSSTLCADFGGPVVTVRIDGREVGSFQVIDPLVLDKHLDRYRRGSRKLSDTAAHYGVPIRGDAHAADADAMAAGRVAWAIARRCAMPISQVADFYMDRRDPMEVAERFYDLGEVDLPNLHLRQIDWAREQAEGLAAHFAKTGKGDPNTVERDWPLVPVQADEEIETALAV